MVIGGLGVTLNSTTSFSSVNQATNVELKLIEIYTISLGVREILHTRLENCGCILASRAGFSSVST